MLRRLLRTGGLGVAVLIGILGVALATSAVTITSSEVERIVIFPNDKPTVVDLSTDQQFVATAYNADGDVVSGVLVAWTTGGDIGVITDNGIFTGRRGGIGTVTASNDGVSGTVGVVVRGVPVPGTTTTNTNNATNTAVTNTSSTTSVEDVTPTIAESDDVIISGEAATTDNNNGAACTTLNSWLWVLILVAYVILLFAYYLSLGDSRSRSWWAWPSILTGGLYVLFFAIKCAGHQLWVPWTIGVLAVLLTAFYLRLLRPRDFEQPVGESVTPSQ